MRRILGLTINAVLLAVFVYLVIYLALALTGTAQAAESPQLSAVRDRIVASRCHRQGPSISVCRALVQGTHLARPPVPRRWAEHPASLLLLFEESSWNPNSVNNGSKACGLFQRLVRTGCPWRVSGVGTRYERVHYPAHLQAANGWHYIDARPGYGTPARAWAFWLAHHWY